MAHATPDAPGIKMPRKPDLADHFIACSSLGRYLTVFDESRFVITDDFNQEGAVNRTAAAVASIFSNDPLVAEAALLPLSKAALAKDSSERESYEELFTLIEAQALNSTVKESAQSLLESGFREARIREIEETLGGKLSPARVRYRAFLEIVRHLTEHKITPQLFRDEFLDFTYAVAGRLDFGIYSFCLDRIFSNEQIPMKAKGFVVSELLGFPATIRRELLTNLLTLEGLEKRLGEFVRDAIIQKLGDVAATEIELLAALKTSQMSMDDINNMIAGSA
ncbi:MAG: hypothetical protein HOL66_00320 [Rhodospirillaceae bacterium]|jgi:hypothetical protein|nr:hypothetical protein [Rhodospirillaceae bacterium]MBT5242667.1 hypothetical protein [Rhodospirillaceae bacterium]MBT5562830.1 hypothetical protein [Rhodospirillaceae bacterium]MBT6241259.1 hypothetical protein [Rhodospirillaceae bacterium]MBT7137102.1 hypothetical protein [Rhodospirillaceae bacterium]